MISIGSLFSGIGGIESGLEKAGGFRTVWFVEKEPYCKEVLSKHWAGIPVYDDITRIDWCKVERPDILTGGFPCQDISNAGRRAGIGGSRSSLWKEYLKAIRFLRPRGALIENVSALLIRGLDVVLCDLAQVGYDAEWTTLRAQDVGAPHRRERVFIIAYPNKERYRGWNTLGQRKSEDGAEAQGRSDDKDAAHPECKGYERTINQKRQITGHCGWDWEQWKNIEPTVRRGDYGFSSRLDSYIWRERIKSLGNAVVPQCAEVFAERIRQIVEDD
jgi:DNA (cytosine-5)-methyltransferase 1